jgi:signal peptidase II
MNQRRKRKLNRPRLQLKLVGIFAGLTALALVLQFMVFTNAATRAAAELPNDGLLYMTRLNRVLLTVAAGSCLVVLPLTFWVGVLVTHRIAGPVYRFERYLEQVARGEAPDDCRLRQGDELQELCAKINLATAPLRRRDRAVAESGPRAGAPADVGTPAAASERRAA